MAKVEVQVKPEIIKWVLREIEFADVPKQVGLQLQSWLSGEKTPTFHQVESISKKTHIPFGYFFLNDPPKQECDIVEYRTINSVSVEKPSRDLIDTVNKMSDIQEWMSDYNRLEGNDPYDYVGRFFNKIESVATVVADIRQELGLPNDWYVKVGSSSDSFRFLRKHISDIGVIVMTNGVVGNNTHRKLNVKEFRAFTKIDKFAPLIFINTCDTDNGKVFSVLHELAHIWIGEDNFYNEPYSSFGKGSKKETFCNSVASELLVPKGDFLYRWERIKKIDNEGKIDELARFYHCSKFVICRKALDTKKIMNEEYIRIIAILNSQLHVQLNDKSKGKGGNYYQTLQSKWDHNFIRTLYSSVNSGTTQYTDAYRLTGTNGKTFEKLIAEIGGTNG